MSDDGRSSMGTVAALLEAKGGAAAAMAWVPPKGFGGGLRPRKARFRAGPRAPSYCNAGHRLEALAGFTSSAQHLSEALPSPHTRASWPFRLDESIRATSAFEAFIALLLPTSRISWRSATRIPSHLPWAEGAVAHSDRGGS